MIFDYAKGRFVEKFMLPVGGDNIVVLLLQASGLQADTTLRTHQTVSAMLSAGNNEATFTNRRLKFRNVPGWSTIVPRRHRVWLITGE